MSQSEVILSQHNDVRATHRHYVVGFIMSLTCTMLAYLLTVNHALSKNWALALVVACLALIQAGTQLMLFLHLGQEARPRQKLLVFGFMITVVFILIAGSIWIMNNLNGRMATPKQINNYMQEQADSGL